MPGPVLTAVLVAVAVLLLLPPEPGVGRRPGRRRAGADPGPTAADVADLAERMAGLARAGVAEPRTWEVLAVHGGPAAGVAGTVAAIVGSGGRTSEGLRLAAATLQVPRSRLALRRRARSAGPAPPVTHPAVALTWLAVAADVVERTGAPSAAVFERITAAVRSEVAALDEQAVATAGARSTATVLSALPAVGVLLGALVGADVLGTLLGTAPGRACLFLGALFWWSGRRWTSRLIRRATTTPPP